MKTITRSLLVLALLATPAMAEQIEPASVRVIDGDTIAVDGHKPNIRLVGFNTPEIRKAKCEDEGRLGVNATNRLRELVRAGDLDLTLVPCACKPGTEGTRACNYGRSCGVLKSNGQDWPAPTDWSSLNVSS
jgi:endonuclease YncB( thermonuclease family)